MYETADPKKRFLVLNQIDLDSFAQTKLFKLYQPLVGGVSISLYQTLIHCFDPNAILSDAVGLYFLQEQLDCSLKQVFISLHKLEAVGLVKTYLMENDLGSIICFQLNQVPSVKAFFGEPLLASLLKEKVGASYFHRLSREFAKKSQLRQKPLRNGRNVSATFFDVFRLPSQAVITPADDVKQAASLNQVGPTPTAKVNEASKIDWQYLADRFAQYQIKSTEIASKKAQIASIMQTYGLSEEEFVAESLPSLHGKELLDLAQIERLIADNYKKETTRKRIQKTIQASQNEIKANENQQSLGLSRQEMQLLKRAQTLSPAEFLYQAKAEKGGFTSPGENRTLNVLKSQYGLPSELINVLIYACLIYDSMVSPNLAYRIANDWLQHGIGKAIDAIKYLAQRRKGQKRNNYHYQGQKRVEKGTDWSKKKAKVDNKVDSQKLKQFFKNLDNDQKNK